MKASVEFIPYGEISSRVTPHRWKLLGQRARLSKSLGKTRHLPGNVLVTYVFVTFSQDLDDPFVEVFRKRATPDTRLLIFNEGTSTDRLISRIVDLQIRTQQRFYVIDTAVGSGQTDHTVFIQSLLNRLSSALKTDDSHERVFDARIEDGVLHVVSPDFNRLEVPMAKIPALANVDPSKVQAFEIDEDGSFIYWPQLDAHLGWAQLQQLVNPEAALKAFQKSHAFNRRYGEAARIVREQAGLERSEIPGMSEKQLRRIENGECRLTSNAIEVLSQALKLAPNDYMQKLAEALG
jgi:hypothetical protein